MSANVWAPGSNNIPVADPNSQIRSEIIPVTSEGQTEFTITQFTYHTGGGALEVYVNGSKRPGSQVNETSSTTFSLSVGCDLGDIVEVVGNTEMASADGAAQTAVNAAAAAAVAKVAAETAETNAEAAQTAAEVAAANTAALYDNFDDRFLGTKAVAPTLDNDGNPLVVGALYFNSVKDAMFVYSSGGWIRTSSSQAPVTLTDAASIDWDWTSGNAIVTLGGNRTLNNPTNAVNGEYRSIRINRSGAYSITAWGSKWKGKAYIVQSNMSGKVDHMVIRYDGPSDSFEIVGYRNDIAGT